MSYSNMTLPSLESAWASLLNVWRPFPWSERWLQVAIAGALLWRYRQRFNAVAFITVVAAGLAWMLGMSMFHVQRARHYFAVGAMLALLYGCGLTGLLFAGQEALSRLESPSLPPRLRRFLVPCAVLILLAIILRGVYPETDAVAYNYSLPDRRNDLAHYMDTSLKPALYITNYDNHKT